MRCPVELNKIDERSYRIHTIKTNRFKTTRVEVIFRLPADKETMYKYSFVTSLLSESNALYKTRREVAIKLEELYKAYFYSYTNKVGNCLNCIFTINFINNEYLKDDNYITDVINFLFDMLYKPNVHSKEFALDSFNIVKKNILLDIDSVLENPEKMAINNALKTMDPTSSSSDNTLGSKEDILKLSNSNIYPIYESLINNTCLDIFICGNTDMEPIVKAILKRVKKHQITDFNLDYYIDNKPVKKPLKKEEKSSFLQTQLVVLYNALNLTKDEKELTFHLMNYILGSGGLSSKLYRYVREENSYCYRISSMYFKYDNLLCIGSSLAKENVNHSLKLIDKAVKEMQSGNLTDEDVINAKQNMLMALKVNRNNPSAILSNYEFKYFINNYDLEEKIVKIENITKEDIVSLAKKLKKNTVYILSEDNNENHKS